MIHLPTSPDRDTPPLHCRPGVVCATRRLLAVLVLVLVLAASAVPGAARAAEPVDLAQALALASQRSGKLGAAAAAAAQSQAQAQAVQGLGGPVLALSALGYSFERRQSISLQPYANNINGLINGLPIPPSLLPLPIDIPPVPDSVSLNLRKTGAAGFVNGLLPLYTGGRIAGVREVAAGRAAEASANQTQDRDEVQATLVQRYFGVQLAARVAAVREATRLGIAEHQRSARRLEAAGLIARVERLQADVAYEGAVREASKAQHDLALAQRALAAMVGDDSATAPLATPLFVDTRPLPPLADYLQRGAAAHPGLAVVRAKRAQALALAKVEEGAHKPSVMAFGVVEARGGASRPDWMMGVSANWVLIDGIDRDAVARSGQAAERRVDEAERQTRQDIALLVERNYRNVDQASVKYLSLRADDALAQELLRLRRKSLAEGLGTAVDLIDAQLNLAKVQTEQAAAAFEYSQSVAALLASVGELDQLPLWAARADIQHR